MTKFRPCIDLHAGEVKQIVGATLQDLTGPAGSAQPPAGAVEPPVGSNRTVDGSAAPDPISQQAPSTTSAAAIPSNQMPIENFTSDRPAEWYAQKYASDGLRGGHVIKLGPGNDHAALAALAAFPGGLQVGGGINSKNAADWIDAGASHVIVTSFLFDGSGRFQPAALDQLVKTIGRARIVIDLSCKRTPHGWTVAMNRWQTLTDLDINSETLNRLAGSCDEFLIHAADVEGLCQGIDQDLVRLIGNWGKIPITYAGGVAGLDDVQLIASTSQNRLDVTVGSALDLFGGTGVKYESLLEWNRNQS